MLKQHVFLCYSSEDLAEAERLHDDLIAAGYSVWWDKLIAPKQDPYFAIHNAIDQSQVLLVALSDKAVARTAYSIYPEARNVLDHYQAYRADARRLVTVRFAACDVPPLAIDEHRTLDQTPCVDLFPDARRPQGLARLLAVLARPVTPASQDDDARPPPSAVHHAAPDTQEHDITQILVDAGHGDEAARNQLWDKVYEELFRIAQRELQRERPGHTLSASDLVHEAYLKLIDHTRISWRNRSHFYALSCEIMRRILIDYARRRSAGKRAGRKDQVQLDEALHMSIDRSERLLELDEALVTLSVFDARLGKVVECKFFGGLSTAETAQALGTSIRTVERDWHRARAYLHQALKP